MILEGIFVWVLLPPLSCHFCLHETRFFHSPTFALGVPFPLKWVSCRQRVVGSCFVFNPLSHILIRAFSPLTFKAIIDWYVLPLYTIKCMCYHFRPLFSSWWCFSFVPFFCSSFCGLMGFFCVVRVCPFVFVSLLYVFGLWLTLLDAQLPHFGQWGSRQAGSRAPAFFSLALIKPWDASLLWAPARFGCISCPKPRISKFFKRSWWLFGFFFKWEMIFRGYILGTRYAYSAEYVSRPFQWPELRNTKF